MDEVIPLGEINSGGIINMLFDFVQKNFDTFGHQGNDWWWNTQYGGSWSPFVETCFMHEAMKYGGKYKIRSCSTQDNIYRYIEDFFRHEFGDRYELGNPDSKYPCRCIDVSWIEQDNSIFLAIEHSEDVPKPKEIQRIKQEIGYSDDQDKDVNGKTAIKQLLGIRDEIYKLKDFKSHFKVLISRPKRFRKIKENGNRRNTISYLDSVNHFKKQIEKDLRKDAESFNDNETWVIILIAPEHGSSGFRNDKIIFYCYEWVGKNEGGNLSNVGEYPIEIRKENGKWIKVPSRTEGTQ